MYKVLPLGEKAASWLHGTVSAGIYLFLLVKAALCFSPDWDYLAYHLPVAPQAFDLTTYRPQPGLRAFIEGFPPMVHWILGLLIALSVRVSAGNLLKLMSVALLSGCAVTMGGGWDAFRWMLTVFLVVPLFVLHSTTGYVDLWTGCWVAILLVSMVGAIEGGLAWKNTAWLVLGAVLCGLTKQQAWPLAAFILVAGAGILLRRGAPASRVVALTVLLASLLTIWPARNWVRHGNPTYPVQPPLISRWIPKEAVLYSVDFEAFKYSTPRFLWHKPKPVAYMMSAFEFTRLMPESGKMGWSIDQHAVVGGIPHRMGGWSYTVFLMLALIYCGARRRKLLQELLWMWLGLMGVASIIPQSHELRYWMGIPLAGAFLAGRVIAGESDRWMLRGKSVLVFLAAFVLVRTEPFRFDPSDPSVFALQEA